MTLVLASASCARRTFLAGAGLDFEVLPAAVDEAALIAKAVGAAPGDIAVMLADAKALAISVRRPQALVIGADQVLVCEGTLYQKADTMKIARANLKRLAGRPHMLVSAITVAEGNSVIWQHHDRAILTMRTLDDAQIDGYLAATGDAALACVGGYALEEQGAWLFEKVEGDYFTVLGLPLLPLLGFLAARGYGPAAAAAA